jgi:hypothetical protein
MVPPAAALRWMQIQLLPMLVLLLLRRMLSLVLLRLRPGTWGVKPARDLCRRRRYKVLTVQAVQQHLHGRLSRLVMRRWWLAYRRIAVQLGQ